MYYGSWSEYLNNVDLQLYQILVEKYNLHTKLSNVELDWLSFIFSNIIECGVYDEDIESESLVNAKDIAEIVLLLKKGKNIQLSANGEKPIIINKEHLKLALIEMLEDCMEKQFKNPKCKDCSMRHCTYSSDCKKCQAQSHYRKKHYMDSNLKECIKIEEKEETIRAKWKGREGKYLARLGSFVFLNSKTFLLSKLGSKTEMYCLLGDMLACLGKIPSIEWEEWEIKSPDEKNDIVKYWVKAYKKLSVDENK